MTATFPLAPALERGACERCSTPARIVFHHKGGRCGGVPVQEPRERPVPCRYASRASALAGQHTTWNVSGVCDGCAQVVASYKDAR